MRTDDFNSNEFMADFAKNLEASGGMQKKASYVLPKNIFDSNVAEDIPSMSALVKEADADNLYGVNFDDIVSGAHPEGSVKIVDAKDELGVVETDAKAQEKMKKLLEKKVTVARKVAALSEHLEEQGFKTLAVLLDEALVGLTTGGEFNKVAKTNEYMQIIDQIGDYVMGTFTVSNPATQHYLGELTKMLNSAAEKPSASTLRAFRDSYFKVMNSVAKSSDAMQNQDIASMAKAMGDVAPAISQLVDNAVTELSKDFYKDTVEFPPMKITPQKRDLSADQEVMKAIQTEINRVAGPGTVSVNGNLGDKATYSAAAKIGLVAGKDYTNYSQLLKLLKAK